MNEINNANSTPQAEEAKNPVPPAPWWNNPAMAWEVLKGRLATIDSGIEASFDLAEARSDGVLFTLRALEDQLNKLRGEIRQVLHIGPEAAQ